MRTILEWIPSSLQSEMHEMVRSYVEIGARPSYTSYATAKPASCAALWTTLCQAAALAMDSRGHAARLLQGGAECGRAETGCRRTQRRATDGVEYWYCIGNHFVT